MADSVTIDFGEWHEHARWWESEAPRVREQLSVDEASLAQARAMFGKIGSSTVGAAFQEVLRARAQAGEVLGAYCEGVASHIRRNLTTYADTEALSQRTLNT